MKIWGKFLIIAGIIILLAAAYWKFAFPVHRVPIQSELVMLGDMDGDRRWTESDVAYLATFAVSAARLSDDEAWRLDLNLNGLIDEEDCNLLRRLIAAGGDPYTAEETARKRGEVFPRPRDFYRYVSLTEYRTRPLWALPYPHAADSVLTWLHALSVPSRLLSHEDRLDAAIYAEAVRFDQAWRQREPDLLPIERDYATQKLARAASLHASGTKSELLLAVIELVEDAETLSLRGQNETPVRLLQFRDHLRDLLASPLFEDFTAGKRPWQDVLRVMSTNLKEDVGLAYDFETLGPARDFTNLENYLQRAEWQYYKSATREENFRALVAYAQHDPRYLNAVARTSRKHQDGPVANHNLPMVLLFREAMRIERGDKKKAAGLLDEAIRIPFGWVKTIPRETLPGSLAYENFLLPGNKEDGADKSRHWNVFGALCLYKTPAEALDLALRRELQDLREANYRSEDMREFLRDMIGNLNGMFHVMVIEPNLLAQSTGATEASGSADP